MIITELIKTAGEQLMALGFLLGIPLLSMGIVAMLTGTWKDKKFWVLFLTILISLIFAVVVYGLIVLRNG